MSKFIKNLLKIKNINNSKEKASQNMGVTRSVIKWLIAAVAPVLAKALIVAIMVCILMAPFAMTHLLIKNAWDNIDNTMLKMSTNVSIFLNDWFILDKKDSEDKNANTYNKYLLKRFESILEKVGDQSMSTEEVFQTKNAAIAWVYGKIYKSYFDATVIDYFSEVIPWSSPNTVKPIKSFEDAVNDGDSEGEERESPEEALKRMYGDKINAYDIQAFDYVAGTVYDLMNLDLELIRKELLDNINSDDLEKAYVKKLADKDVYGKYGGKLINAICSKNREVFEKGITNLSQNLRSIRRFCLDKGIDFKLTEYRLNDGVYNQHYTVIEVLENANATLNDYRWSWLISGLKMTSKHSFYDGEYTAKKFISSEDDMERLIWCAENIDIPIKQYIENIDDKEYKAELLEHYEKLKSASTHNGFIDKTVKEYRKKIVEYKAEVENDLISVDAKELLSKQIEHLKLDRTQKAADAYKEYLLATKPAGKVSYKTLDVKSIDVIKELASMKKYSSFDVDVKSDGEFKIKLKTSSKTYKENIRKELANVNNLIFDKKGNPVISGRNSNTKQEYLTDRYVNVVDKFILVAKQALDDINNSVDNTLKVFSDGGESYFNEQIENSKNEVKEIADKILKTSVYSKLTCKDVAIHTNVEKTYVAEIKTKIKVPSENELKKIDESGDDKILKDIGKYLFATNKSELNSKIKEYYSEPVSDKEIDEYDGLMVLYAEKMDDLYKAVKLKKLALGKDSSVNIEKLKKDLNAIKDEESVKINKIILKLEEYKKVTNFVDQSICIDADMSTTYKLKADGSYAKGGADSKYIASNDKSTVEILTYVNSIEEAVKRVAEEFYEDVLVRINLKNKTSFGGSIGGSITVSLDGLELGANANMSNSSFANTMKHWDTIKSVCDRFNFDPYLMVAIICTESSGNQYSYNGKAAGLTQIEHVHWGKTVSLKDKNNNIESFTITKDELLSNVELAIKAGIWEMQQNMNDFNGNLPAAIVGYNFGPSGCRYTVWHYLCSQGQGSLGDWPGVDPPSSVSKKINDYLSTGDTGWLSSRQWYSSEGHHKFSGAGGGTANHLEKLLSYYYVDNGQYPWYINSKTGQKVNMLSGGASVTPDKGDGSTSTEDNSNKYHKNNRLILWKEFYSSNGVFEEADKWAKENKYKGEYTKDVCETIKDVVGENEKKIISAGLTTTETQNIIAGIINYKNNFKFDSLDKKKIKKEVTSILEDYLDCAKQVGKKGVYFVTYMYVSEDRELCKEEILNYEDNFIDYLKEKHGDEANSTTDIDDNVLTTIKIMSGKLDANIESIYNASDIDNIDNAVLETPLDAFYREWFEAKELMHEIYNVVTDGTGAPSLSTNMGGTAGGALNGVISGETIHRDLTKFKMPTEKELNDFIAKVSNGNGSFNGNAAIFIKASQLSGLDPVYLVAHAGLESGWGYADLNKSNYFGIGAYNGSEFESALTFGSGLEQGICQGAQWINKNYTSVGQNSLYLMIHPQEAGRPAGHIYAQNDDGTPNLKWMRDIASIMDRAPWYSGSAGVTVNGQASKGDISAESNRVISSDEKAIVVKSKGAEYTISLEGLSDKQKKLIQEAVKHIGKTYVSGANGPDTFDCSGFTQYVYKKALGKDITRTTYSQINEGAAVGKNDLVLGDLYFPHSGHVGIYIGNNLMIHAPSTGDVVKIGPVYGDNPSFRRVY